MICALLISSHWHINMRVQVPLLPVWKRPIQAKTCCLSCTQHASSLSSAILYSHFNLSSQLGLAYCLCVLCVCVCVCEHVCVCVALWLVWHQPALGVCCLHFPCFLRCLNFYLFSPAFTSHLVVRSEQFTHERPIDWLAVGSDHVIVMLLFTHSDTRCAGFCLPLAKHAVMRQERLTASGPQYWQPVCSDIVYYIYS